MASVGRVLRQHLLLILGPDGRGLHHGTSILQVNDSIVVLLAVQVVQVLVTNGAVWRQAMILLTAAVTDSVCSHGVVVMLLLVTATVLASSSAEHMNR